MDEDLLNEVLVFLAVTAQKGQIARKIVTVTYGALARKFGGAPVGWGARLNPLVLRMHEADLPLLPVLVVSLGKTVPSPEAGIYSDLGLDTPEKLRAEQTKCINHDWSSVIDRGRL